MVQEKEKDRSDQKNANVGVEIDYRHELVEGDTACQYSYYYASIIGKGAASIIDNPREKLKALNVIMKHQTGRTFDEFQKIQILKSGSNHSYRPE